MSRASTMDGTLPAGAAATSQPQPADASIELELPTGFVEMDALKRIAAYVARQLHSGLSEREITDRLHGYQRTRGEVG